jgi:hypothetical protein
LPDFLLEHLETKTTKRLTVDEDRILIGRNPAAEIALSDSGVSKNHVVIERHGDGYTFRDLGSSNGTRHNNDECSSGTLRPGDQLRIGRVRITVLFDGPNDSSTETPETSATQQTPETSPSAVEEAVPVASVVPDAVTAADALPTEDGAVDDVLRAPKALCRRSTLVLSIFIGTFLVGIGAGTAIGFLMRDKDPISETDGSDSPPRPGIASPALPSTGTSMDSRAPVTPDAGLDATVAIAHSHALQVLNRELPALQRNKDALYSDHEESERTLFRMYLDLLRRPPTRDEARRDLTRGHLDRWETLTTLQTTHSLESLTTDEVFQIFLGRAASETEKLEILKWPAQDLPLLGSLLTATREYRAPSHRRERDPHQLARSLYVDLRDEAEPSEDDLRRVETILTDSTPSTARSTIARLLASSSLLRDPRKEHDTTTESLVRWIQSETRRFLQRPASSDELKPLLGRMKAPGVDLRWYRMAMAASKNYGSY